MDIVNIEALVAQGKIVKTPDIDPNNDYVVIGKWQANNRKKGGDGNAYPSYAVPLSELLGGGGSGDKNFVYTQAIASNTWVVPHNLSKRCSVTIVDSFGQQIIGAITWDSDNQVTVKFNQAVSGFVYCN